MKALLALFLLAATSLPAAWATGTEFFYSLDNTFADATGKYADLTQTAITPVFVNSPAPSTGTYWCGTFTAARYLKFPALAVKAVTDAQAANAFTIDIRNVRFNSVNETQLIFGFENSNGGIVYLDGASHVLYWASGGVSPNYMGCSGALSKDTNYRFRFTWNGTTRTAYVNAGAGITNLVNPAFANNLNAFLGVRSLLDIPFNGYASGFRLMTICLTNSDLIVDPAGASIPNPRNPNLRNTLRLRLGWLFQLFTMPNDLMAQSQDQLQEHAYVKAMDKKVNLATSRSKAMAEVKIIDYEKVVDEIVAKQYEISKSPTPTPTATATTTPTATATTTPEKGVK